MLGVVDRGGTLSLWATSGREPKARAGSLTGISSFAFSRQSAMLVGAQESGSVVVWSATEGRRMAQFECPGKKPAVAINATGAVVAALCAGHLHVWRADPSWDRAEVISVPALEAVWTHLALDDTSETVVLGRNTEPDAFDAPSYIALIHLSLGGNPKSFPVGERIQAMVFTPDGLESSLVLGGEGGRVWVQPLNQVSQNLPSRETQTLFQRSTPVTALSFNENGSRLIAGYQDGVANIFDLHQVEVTRLVGDGPATSVALSDETGQAFSVGRTLQAWNLAKLDSLFLQRVLTAQFYTDPPLLLYRSYRYSAFLDLRTRTEVARWDGRSYPITISQDEAIAAVTTRNPPTPSPSFSLTVCEFSTRRIGAHLWEKPVAIRGLLENLGFSHDGKHLTGSIVLSDRPGVFVWNAATGAEEVYLPDRQPLLALLSSFSFTPDSQRILFAPVGGRLRSRRLDSQEEEGSQSSRRLASRPWPSVQTAGSSPRQRAAARIPPPTWASPG